MKRRRWSVQLSFIFGMIVLSFVASTVFTEWRSADIDRSALEITDNTAPSIEHLTAARSELRHLQVLLRDGLDRAAEGRFEDHDIAASRARLGAAVGGYLVLPTSVGEHELWVEVLQRRDAVNDAVTRCVAEAERGDLRSANAHLHGDVATTADALGATFTQNIAFHASRARDLAVHIRTLRASSVRAAAALDLVCALITIAGAVVLRRAIRAHDALVERHGQLVSERAQELEQFAGRIAHDILSPLGTVTLALQLSDRPGMDDQRAVLVERATGAVRRVKRLVDGLLGFARAGAKPEPGAHTEVTSTINDLVADLQSAAAEAGAEIRVSADLTCHVACAGGVLTSVVSNLAGNAIKYIGTGPIRRLEIRAREEAHVVRVELEDTGPGLAVGSEEHVFEPYVRGRAATQPGIGLGLATVKRLVEGHGGRVGVRSMLGQGCTFWFELPKVAAASLDT